MSTYDYIKQQRERKVEVELEAARKKNKQVSNILHTIGIGLGL